MRKILILSLLFLLCFQTLLAKDGYRITGEVKGLKNKTSVMLAYYFGGKQYATDTAIVKKGKFTFEGDKKLKGGMYLVVLPESQYFDIIVSEQRFSFSTEIDNLIGSMEFSNSAENPPFYEYLNFITQMQKEVTPIRKKLETAKGDRKEALQIQAQEIDAKVKAYRKNFVYNNYDKFFPKIVLAATEIEIPESPLDQNGNPDETFPYRFYKKHFWDNIDFSDERMLRTPIFFSKMDQYLDKLTAKHPDSINVSADVLVNLSKANAEIFQYVVSYITSTYERSKTMGMDAVFVHMVEKYYITGQCNWVDEEQLLKIADRAQKISPNLIGSKAPEFVDYYGRPFMKDLNGKLFSLKDVSAEYTVLLFYGPTSSYCNEVAPKLRNTINTIKNQGLDVKTFAVATEFSKNDWSNFIENHGIYDWINVADINHDDEGKPVASSDWRDKYDIYSTPVIYLLDKYKKIVAKRITADQLSDILLRINDIDPSIATNITSSNNSSSINNSEELEKAEKDRLFEQYILSKQAIEGYKKESFSSLLAKNIPVNKKIDNRYALIIGNEDYTSYQRGLDSEQDVDYAVNDAKIFKEFALKTLGVKEDNMFFHIDVAAVKMRREINKVQMIMEALGSKGELIVYYAGHGYPDELTKVPYLIPVDVSAVDLDFAYKLNDLYKTLAETNASKITIFLDACFTGGGRESGLMASRGVKVKPKEGTLNGNIVVFSASSKNQSALPYHKERHGIFTFHLLKILKEKEGDISYGDLYDRLKVDVNISCIKENSKQQEPQVNTSEKVINDWRNWKF
jgi:hypothetical protein